MKQLIYILTITLLTSCNNSVSKDIISNKKDSLDLAIQKNDSVIALAFRLDIKDSNILNTSNRRIDVLFNGVDKFLDGKKHAKVNFMTECMVCQPFQAYNKGLLFGKRLYVGTSEIKCYPNDINISDTINRVKTIGYYGERKKMNFVFRDGKGTMQYLGQSCSDADNVKVKLKYDTGEIEINNLLNASFFEYDLDKDGATEQYLVGTRNCSQELVILRIQKAGVAPLLMLLF